MSELKPCHFCGGEAKFNVDGDSNFSYIANGAAWVSCLTCEAEGATIFTDKDEISVMESDRVSKLAINSWNYRATDNKLTTITKQRDELLKCLETVNSHAIYRAGTFNNGETVAQYAARVISTIKEQKDAQSE